MGGASNLQNKFGADQCGPLQNGTKIIFFSAQQLDDVRLGVPSEEAELPLSGHMEPFL